MNRLYIKDILSEEEDKKEWEGLQYQRKYWKTLRATAYVLIMVAVGALFLAMMFVPVFQVSCNSMEPTLVENDVIVLLKTENVQIGDLVCFYHQNKLLLKRVIGSPEDIIDIDEKGNVIVNGEILNEPYLLEKELGQTDIIYPYQVPKGCYFVMEDSRSLSIDSRSSVIGCIETDQIIGKVVFRIWPIGRISLFQ